MQWSQEAEDERIKTGLSSVRTCPVVDLRRPFAGLV
jgi:hypothetical protein